MDTPQNEEPKVFISGYAPFSDMIYCAQMEADTKAQIPEGEFPFSFHLFDEGKFGEYGISFNWAPIAVASIKPVEKKRVVIAVGTNGRFYEMWPATADQQTGVLPGSRFIATNLAVVNETIYAVGMGRAIARWDGPMTWTRLDPEIAKEGDGAIGFNDLVGFTSDEIYTVGWGGEIFKTDGKDWQKIKSPVSRPLRAACIGADQKVYAVGYDGTMVCGRDTSWSVVKTGLSDTLLDVVAFKNEILVATAFNVFILGPDGLSKMTNFEDPQDTPASCVGLCATADGSGVFWLGGQDLFLLTDSTWNRVLTDVKSS